MTHEQPPGARVPHRCPVCNGCGMVQYDPNMPYAMSHTSAGPWPCRPCGASGIIWASTRTEGKGG